MITKRWPDLEALVEALGDRPEGRRPGRAALPGGARTGALCRDRLVGAAWGRPASYRALILVEDLPVPFDRRVWSEARTLRDAGWRVTVVCPRGEGARRWHETLEGIEVYRYPLPTTAAGLLNHVAEYAVAIPATLILSLLAWRGRRFDVVHACNPPDFLFPIGWLFRAMGSAFIFDQHDLAPEVYVAQGGRKGGRVHRFLLWCERQTYRLADVIISTNETYRRFALDRGRVPPERVFVVRSSPDPTRIHPTDPDPELKAGRRFLAVYLGTMGPQDGVDLFVQAARRVLDERPGAGTFRGHGWRQPARGAAGPRTLTRADGGGPLLYRAHPR